MRLDEVMKNLGAIAGSVVGNLRDAAVPGAPLAELDLTLVAPHTVALAGPGKVVITTGEIFRVSVDDGSHSDEPRFAMIDGKLTISGGEKDTVVRLALPAVRGLTVAGSGRIKCEALAADGEVTVAGSGRIKVRQVHGGSLSIRVAGSGRIVIDGEADSLELAIAGSGSCDGEGLAVHRASVSIAGSGDAIFGCDGEVSASLMGSGNVIVRGAARCSVSAVGSGTLVCERDKADA